MSDKGQLLVRRALGGHAALGLLAGALLYIIALTGTVVVIHDRLQRWEQPSIAEVATLSPAAAQSAMVAAVAQGAGRPATTHLYFRMPSAGLPRAVVTTDTGAWYVDEGGRLAGREAHAWTEMVIGLHEYLHLPVNWGMILVGMLGVVLAALAVTGVLAHPRIVRDAFCLRTRHDPQIARADWHNRLGVWTLPFVLAVTLTGSFIGLSSVGYSVLAKAYTGGDLERVYAPIYGAEAKFNPAPAPLPDIRTALTTLAARVPSARPTYVIVHEPGTRGQHVQVLGELPRRLVYGDSYSFDAAGRWMGPAGLSDGAIGQQFAASTYNLHFGNFGGLAVEVAYMLLGLALCLVTATGTTLWLTKRRRRGMGSDRLDASWTALVWGTPLALIAAAGAEAPLVAGFWSGLALLLAVAIVRPLAISPVRLRGATLMGLVATGLGHALLLQPAVPAVLAIDVVLVAMPVLVWAVYRRFQRAPERPAANAGVAALRSRVQA
jgi:uncharacterized iron-regulated membrane protein